MSFAGLLHRWIRRRARETPPAVAAARGTATPDSYVSPASAAAAAPVRRGRRQDFPFVYIPGGGATIWDAYLIGPTGRFFDFLPGRTAGRSLDWLATGRLVGMWAEFTHGRYDLARSDARGQDGVSDTQTPNAPVWDPDGTTGAGDAAVVARAGSGKVDVYLRALDVTAQREAIDRWSWDGAAWTGQSRVRQGPYHLGSIRAARSRDHSKTALAWLEPSLRTSAQGRNAGAAADDPSIGTEAWTNTGNATGPADGVYSRTGPLTPAGAVDGAYADGEVSHYIKFTGFGFGALFGGQGIPSDAVILGFIAVLTLTVDRDRTFAASPCTNVYAEGQWHAASMLKAGAFAGTAKIAAAGANLETAPDGGNGWIGDSQDLWGASWTPADVNGSGFGIALAIKAQTSPAGVPSCVGATPADITPGIDSVELRVYYREPNQHIRYAEIGLDGSLGTIETVADVPTVGSFGGGGAQGPDFDQFIWGNRVSLGDLRFLPDGTAEIAWVRDTSDPILRTGIRQTRSGPGAWSPAVSSFDPVSLEDPDALVSQAWSLSRRENGDVHAIRPVFGPDPFAYRYRRREGNAWRESVVDLAVAGDQGDRQTVRTTVGPDSQSRYEEGFALYVDGDRVYGLLGTSGPSNGEPDESNPGTLSDADEYFIVVTLGGASRAVAPY